jgi:hypothetical protein
VFLFGVVSPDVLLTPPPGVAISLSLKTEIFRNMSMLNESMKFDYHLGLDEEVTPYLLINNQPPQSHPMLIA